MTLLALACLVAMTAVVLRWWLRRVDALGRRRAFPVWSTVLLVVLGVALATPGVRRELVERRLERVAGALAGRDVSVRCQTLGGAFVDAGAELGWVPYDDDGRPLPETLLKHEPCRDLRAYLGSDRVRPTLQQVVAVHVLTHEAMHMSGLTDEARTECAAVQRNARTARLLGAPPEAAVALARSYWSSRYPDLPESYRSGDCRPGGALDEGLPDPPW